MEKSNSYKIYCDGGARGNPGPAAYGFVIYNEHGSRIHEESKAIGTATNNVAEYSSVIAALKYVANGKYHMPRVKFFMDSKLTAEQLSGKWKVKNENLRNLYFTVRKLEQKIVGKISYEHIRREENQEADRLVNRALDQNSS